MPEINNSLALQVNPNSLDLQKTLGTISQLQLSNAHAGLYGLQAQQEARKLNALEVLKQGGNWDDYVKAGGDPSNANLLQEMYQKQAIRKRFGGLDTGDVKNLAETGKIGAETNTVNAGLYGRIGNMLLTDPSPQGIASAVAHAKESGINISSLDAQNYLRMTPEQATQVGKQFVALGMGSKEYAETPEQKAPYTTVQTDPSKSIWTQADITNRSRMQNGAIPTGQPPSPYGQPVQPVQPAPPYQGGPGMPPKVLSTADIVPNADGRLPQFPAQPGPVVQGLSPAQIAEQRTYGEAQAKVLPELATKAEGARQQNFTLDQMKAESQSWRMGKWAETQNLAQQYMKPIANALGSDMFDKPVADFESFKKNAGTLTRQAVKEVSSRAAAQEFTMIQNQLPSADMSQQGFNQIANQFQAVNDYQIAKHQAGQAWLNDNGTLNKFEADWNKNVSPTAFLIRRLPPEQQVEMRDKLSKTAEGRETLKSITKQLQWAHDHNLDQMVQ